MMPIMMPIMSMLFFGSIIIFLAILAAIIWFFMRIGGTSKNQTEDARLIQELHQGLEKMEGRIEALETILLDSQKHKGEQP
jgi:phage shock protein B